MTMHPRELPNAPTDTERTYTGDEISVGNAHRGGDWKCVGCGTRLNGTKIRMCPDCGHTIFDYDPQ